MRRGGAVVLGVVCMLACGLPTPAGAADQGPPPLIASGNGADTCAAIDGVVRCWGVTFGPKPVRITGIPADDGTAATRITSLSSADGAACVTQGGVVRCWGPAPFSWYANPDMTQTAAAVVPGFGEAKTISVGGVIGPVCGIDEDRRVRCMGSDNRAGQLGNGTTTPSLTPQVVPGLTGVTAVDGSTWHACAIHDGGKVSCWGANQWQQLGIPRQWDSSAYPLPQPLPIDDAEALDAGIESNCVIRRNGAVACWGAGGYSQFLGGPVSGGILAAVDGVSDPSAVTAGEAAHCAIVSGRARCWGRNDQGQIGYGEVQENGGVPTKEVVGLRGVRAITAGLLNACAITGNGVWCWGWNHFRQLGDPDFTAENSPTPRKVPGSDDWLAGVDGIIDTKGPFSQIQTTKDLRCGRQGEHLMFGLLRPVFFRPQSCGTWVRSGNTVFGPAPAGLEAPWQRTDRSWEPLDQTESGSGTEDDPWRIETTVRGGDLEVTQNDRYVDGANLTRTTLTIENTADSVRELTAYFGGDCRIGDGTPAVGALEYGWQSKEDFLSNATGCATSPYNGHAVTLDAVEDSGRPTDRYSYAGDTPALVAGQIGAPNLSEQTVTGIALDAASLVATKTALAPGEKVVLRFHTRYGATDAKDAAPEPVPTGGEGDPSPPAAQVPWNMLAIGAPAAWAKGLSGAGQNVAIVDTGVDNQHPWLGDPVAEGCWSSKIPGSIPLALGFSFEVEGFLRGTCPVDPYDDSATGYLLSKIRGPLGVQVPDAVKQLAEALVVSGGRRMFALNCMFLHDLTDAGAVTGKNMGRPKLDPCMPMAGTSCTANVVNLGVGDTFFQGTFVAGLAAGRDPDRVAGVAPGAGVIAANVSSWRTDGVRQTRAGLALNGKTVVANPEDQAKALEWVDRQRKARRIAAVNLMLPGRLYRMDRSGYSAATCAGQHPRLEKAVASLISHNIPVVVPAGDDGDKKRLPWPACLPGVISVGATDQDDRVIRQSNSSKQLTLLAPGADVRSATTGDRRDPSPEDFTTRTGTYAAAAHVTGAIALFKQQHPRATTARITKMLRDTGIRTTDATAKRTTPRLRVDQLLNAPYAGGG